MQKALTNIALAFVAIVVVQTMCNFNPPSTATTTVFVYQDLNNNGEFDQGEPPFPDITVNPSGVTDQDGNLVYQKTFTNTRECIGVSEVGVTVPEGYSLSQSQIDRFQRDDAQPRGRVGASGDPSGNSCDADCRLRDGTRSDQAFLQAAPRRPDSGHVRPCHRAAGGRQDLLRRQPQSGAGARNVCRLD